MIRELQPTTVLPTPAENGVYTNGHLANGKAREFTLGQETKTIVFKAGEIICTEDKLLDVVLVLVNGHCQLRSVSQYPSSAGKERVLRTLQPPSVLNYWSLLEGKRAPGDNTTFKVVAESETAVLVIPREDLSKLSSRYIQALIKDIVTIQTQKQKYPEFSNVRFRTKEAAIIKTLASLAIENPDAKHQEVTTLQITHEQLAELVGTSRETITRTIATLRKGGVVKTRRQRYPLPLIEVNIPALRKLAGLDI